MPGPLIAGAGAAAARGLPWLARFIVGASPRARIATAAGTAATIGTQSTRGGAPPIIRSGVGPSVRTGAGKAASIAGRTVSSGRVVGLPGAFIAGGSVGYVASEGIGQGVSTAKNIGIVVLILVILFLIMKAR